MNAWALARFRSSANACSHWAMPSAARLVNISTYPNNLWARAWSGTDDKALLNFASAAAKAAIGLHSESSSLISSAASGGRSDQAIGRKADQTSNDTPGNPDGQREG